MKQITCRDGQGRFCDMRPCLPCGGMGNRIVGGRVLRCGDCLGKAKRCTDCGYPTGQMAYTEQEKRAQEESAEARRREVEREGTLKSVREESMTAYLLTSAGLIVVVPALFGLVKAIRAVVHAKRVDAAGEAGLAWVGIVALSLMAVFLVLAALTLNEGLAAVFVAVWGLHMIIGIIVFLVVFLFG